MCYGSDSFGEVDYVKMAIERSRHQNRSSMKHTEMLRSDDELRHLMFTMEDVWVELGICQLGVTFSTSNAKNTIRVEERMK